MEEDIKILEEYIEWVKKEGIEVCGMEKELPALENLLTRYKQLEEENKKFNPEVWHNEGWDRADEYWKSKVKEKIEEKKEQRRNLGFKTYLRREDMLNDDRAIACEIATLEDLIGEE